MKAKTLKFVFLLTSALFVSVISPLPATAQIDCPSLASLKIETGKTSYLVNEPITGEVVFTNNTAPVTVIFNATVTKDGQVILSKPSFIQTQLGRNAWSIKDAFGSDTLPSAGTYTLSVIASYTPLDCTWNANLTLTAIAPAAPNPPHIDSLIPSSAIPGAQVIVQGSNFTPTGNDVKSGSTMIASGLTAAGGNTIIFTVPNVPAGQYPITISNQNGTSNEVVFTVLGAPHIDSLSPVSAPFNSTVTINGSGFTPTGNQVKSGSVIIGLNLSSADGKTLSFIVPDVSPGTYPVSVQNANGNSNEMSFTVAAAKPQIESLTPSSSQPYTQITVKGINFTRTGNDVKSGSSIIASNVSSIGGGTSMVFTVPNVPAGQYPITISNSNGVSNEVVFTVLGGPHIDSLNPSSGSVGSTVIINGSGFTATGNNIKSGNTVIGLNVSSTDGKTLIFTVPDVSPGVYPISVSNANGNSNEISFTVLAAIPRIESLTPSSAQPYTQITVRGLNFTPTGNDVKSGASTIASNVPSNGTVLNFTVPDVSPGAYPISVSNQRGTSNEVSFTVLAPPPVKVLTSLNILPSEYLLGQTVTGSVVLTNPTPKEIKADFSIELYKDSVLFWQRRINGVSIPPSPGPAPKVISYSLDDVFGFKPIIPDEPSFVGDWKLLIRRTDTPQINDSVSQAFTIKAPIPQPLILAFNFDPREYFLGDTLRGEGTVTNPGSSPVKADFKIELFQGTVLKWQREIKDISIPSGTANFTFDDLFGTKVVIPNEASLIGDWKLKITQIGTTPPVSVESEFSIKAQPITSSFIFSNDNTGFSFKNGNNGITLGSIKNKKTGFVINNTSPIIWTLRVRDKQGNIIDVLPQKSGNFSYSETPIQNGKSLSLSWTKVFVPNSGQSNFADVNVTVRLDDNSNLASWNISVNAQGLKDYVLWNVAFPIIAVAPLRGDPGNDYLWYPTAFYSGGLLDNPVAKLGSGHSFPAIRNPGPSGLVQFAALYDYSKFNSKEGIYFATQDSKGFTKNQRFFAGDGLLFDKQSIVFGIEQFPEDMLTPGKDYQSPYATVIGPLRGDWYDAAKLYRSWALRQPWSRLGPLYSRQDISPLIKEGKFVVVNYADERPINPKSSELINEYKKEFKLDSLINFWNNWHNNNFDCDLPNHFPARPNFQEQVGKMHNMNIKVMPYVSGLLWQYTPDDPLSSWVKEGAEKYAIKDENGKVFAWTLFGCSPNTQGAQMDPTTSFWQNKITDIIKRLINEYKVDGVYLDQVTAATSMLDFDPGRNRRGGGSFFTEGITNLLRVSRETGRQYNPDFFITSEEQEENYIPEVDAVLGLIHAYWSPKEKDFSIIPPPAIDTVYHDYLRPMGGLMSTGGFVFGTVEFPSTLVLGSELGLNFIRGNLLGIMEGKDNMILHKLQSSEDGRSILNYFRALIETYSTYAKKYLVYGELLRPLYDYEDISASQLIKIKTRFGGGREDNYYVPKVLSSAWKANDGTRGLVFTNYNKESQAVTLNFRYSDYGIQPGTKLFVNKLSESGRQYIKTVSGDFSQTINLEPYSVLVFELSTTAR